MNHRPLEGIVVLDFSQFLSGPYASLRLADLGARVIKIERPDGGDICRRLYISNLQLDGDSTLFHSINRNKESYAVNLKDENDKQKLKTLMLKADVVIQNFRPGVIEKLGFDYETVKTFHPHVVYGSISGYGKDGVIAKRPGQDLLVQSFTGLPWLHGKDTESTHPSNKPIPFGLAIADMISGAHLAQGILAALVRKSMRGVGAHIEVSLLESTLDVMQEVWMDKLQQNDLASSSCKQTKEAWLPEGLYATSNGYLALRSILIADLVKVLEPLDVWEGEQIVHQEHISSILRKKSSHYWTKVFHQAGIACEELLDWRQLVHHEAFRALDMTQQVFRNNGMAMTALACPIRFNGQRFHSSRGAPRVGEHNQSIDLEWLSHAKSTFKRRWKDEA